MKTTVDNLREPCRQGIKRIMTQYNWYLVTDEAAFLDSVLVETQRRLHRTQSRSLEKVIRDATVNRYSHLWHAACGDSGSPRQERALQELHSYMYAFALRASPDESLVEDVVQESMIKAWSHLDQVHDPGAFLMWIQQVVIQRIARSSRKAMRRSTDSETGKEIWGPIEISLSDLSSEEDPTAYLESLVNRFNSTDEPEVRSLIRTQIESAIRKCLRGRLQREAIIKTFLDGKDHVEVAAELGTSPQNLSVLKSKALTRLRRCPEFLNLLHELTEA